jgi:Putative prokaryotic signal transducing protein
MDADAKENCEEILNLLEDAGIQAVVADDGAPGVPEGVFEVRVPAPSAARAEKLIAENLPEDEVKEVDPSSDLDLENIASSAGEMEALSIKNLLESNGIAAMLVGDSVLPNLSFDVRVARDQAVRARQLLADIETGGPAAAEEAELESESGS